jgi:hypothetical protein
MCERTREPLSGLSINLITESFNKICRYNKIFVKVGTKTTGIVHEDLYGYLSVSAANVLNIYQGEKIRYILYKLKKI